MKLEIYKTNIITNVKQWQQFAPPMGKEKHWKDGRSAKSNAVVSNNQDFEDFSKYIGLSKDGGTIKKLNVMLTIKKVEISLN